MSDSHSDQLTQQTPAYVNIFILADEWDPRRKKVVRRVIVNQRMADRVHKKIDKMPDIFSDPKEVGLLPKHKYPKFKVNRNPKIGIARHVKGEGGGDFISTSRIRPFGSPRISGRPFGIDVEKARAAGCTFHDVGEILTDLQKLKARTKDPKSLAKIEEVIRMTQQDREVLIGGEGGVPPFAIEGMTTIGLRKVMHGLGMIQIMFSAIEIEAAVQESRQTHSIKPIAHETVRQFGGWVGASAGMRIGASVGTLVGIETGPGVVLSAGAGSMIGGFVGYFSVDWVNNIRQMF